MPKSIARERELDDLPDALRPYRFHGLDVRKPRGSNPNVTTDCPFCGKEGKFNINSETGQWRCWVCNEGFDKADKNGHVKAERGGNLTEFLRLLWKYCDESTTSYDDLVQHRELLSFDTLIRWEVVQSFLTGEWMVPGYSVAGKLVQLYKYVSADDGRMKLLPTPEAGGHALLGLGGFNPDLETVEVFEGPWDGIAAEEVFRGVDDEWNEGTSTTCQAVDRNIIAVPGCNAFLEKWYPLFKGKVVRFWFDSDHRREHPATKRIIEPAGWLASLRNGQALQGTAKEVFVLRWGPEGYDHDLPSGFDVRDSLRSRGLLLERSEALRVLMSKFENFASKEILGDTKTVAPPPKKLGPKRCESYPVLIEAWKKAMRWRDGLEDVLSVMLSVALSTMQTGSQLFLQVLGDAGSGKTRFCDAMLTSDSCYALEQSTGLHSGYMAGNGSYAPIKRMNGKTLITAEGDTIVSSPYFPVLMSQFRRAFDGKSSHSFKNMEEDQSEEGLRMPWIMAGTFALLNSDNAQLGDRFLKIIIERPEIEEQEQITLQVATNALEAVRIAAVRGGGGDLSPKMREAYQLTGGYVEYLKANTWMLETIEFDKEDLARCAVLGEFAACLRARPAVSRTKEKHDLIDSKEMPNRLTEQFVRVAACQAVVWEKTTVDEDVMRLVRKLALNTSVGITMAMCKHLYKEQEDGMRSDALAHLVNKDFGKVRELLKFLKTIGVTRADESYDENGKKTGQRWRLAPHMLGLMRQVLHEWGNK